MGQRTNARSRWRPSPALLESTLDFRILPMVAQTGQPHGDDEIVGVVPSRRNVLVIGLQGIRLPALGARFVDQPDPRPTEQQSERIMGRSPNPSQRPPTMDAHLTVTGDLQGVTLRQLAGPGWRPRQAADQLETQFQKLKSPFLGRGHSAPRQPGSLSFRSERLAWPTVEPIAAECFGAVG